jgi:hypothetical protein
MKTILLVLFLTIALGTTFATSTTSELVISNGAGPGVSQSCAITDVGGSPSLVSVGTYGCSGLTTESVTATSISVGGTFTTGLDGSGDPNVWNLHVVLGLSGTPNANGPGLDVTSLVAVCNTACGNAALEVWFSDVGFTTSATHFTNTYSGTLSGSGSTSQTAWVSATNNLLAQTSVIGTVGPVTGAGGFGSVSGGGSAGPAPYSLTLEEVFVSDAQQDLFSVDGSITTVPEPMSLLLLGGCLFVVGRKLKSRLA